MNIEQLAEIPRTIKQRERPTHCAECGFATREGKPYCSEHVLLHPYAREVEERIRNYRINDDDIIQTLRVYGVREIARLAREHNIEFKKMRKHVHKMARAGTVVLVPGSTRRGSGGVALAE